METDKQYTISYENTWWNVYYNGALVDGFACPVDAGLFVVHLLKDSRG